MRLNLIKRRYAMAVDTRRCVGCNACVLACKAENGLSLESFRSWIETESRGTYPNLALEIRSSRCEQCSDAACVRNCPTGASYYGEGGIVLVDRDLCTGCKACLAACPYEARTISPAGYADKCTFCLHRVRKGQLPACASNCPSQALTFGDLNDRDGELVTLLRTRQWKQPKADAGTKPNLYFLT
jgi:Fe-S-cluster-containing dehydrogenase component